MVATLESAARENLLLAALQDYARWHSYQFYLSTGMAEPLVRPKDALDVSMLSACSLPLPAAMPPGLQAQLLAHA